MTRLPSRPPGSGVSPASRGGALVATPVPSGLIGRYQVLDKIGEGGMGSLFLARDPAIDRLVAIKLLRNGLDTEALRERFAREARAAGRLRHPHIVTIFDVGEHENHPFIAMEFLAGETLAELIRDGARLSLSRRLKLLEELCDGLAYAHRSGLVHRDIKPANLMVDADGVLKILDFGIVRVDDSGMTQAGALVGTLNYMSPEQVVGAVVDHRSDIFAVGLVAYELISGRAAFGATMKDGLLNKILDVAVDPLPVVAPGVDPDVTAIVEQAMRKDPGNRYQDLVRMRNDLARARVRIEREEELHAAAAAAEAGETAVIGDHPTVVPDDPQHPAAAMVHDAERALEVGDYRAALTLAGRSAALNPHDRLAGSIAARAEAALLDKGRLLQSGTPPPTPSHVFPEPAPTPASSVSSGGGHALWIAVAIALVALGVAVAALWFRNPATGSLQSSVAVPSAVPPAPTSSSAGTPPPRVAPAEPAASGSTDGSPVDAPPSPQRPGGPPEGAVPAAREAQRGSRDERPADRRPDSAGREVPPAAAAPAVTPSTEAAPLAPPPPPAGPPAPLRSGIDVSAPRLLQSVTPVYPPEMQASGVEGTVSVELTISPKGQVSDARVVRSVRGLDEAALAAVRQWQFAAPQRNGEEVTIVHVVDVPFKLPAAVPPPLPKPSASIPPPVPAAGRGAEAARPAPAPVPDPREEVRAVLRRYKAAWEALDAEALARVQALSASEAADVRGFMASANRYELDMSVQSITVDPSGARAVARVALERRFQPKIGRPERPRRTAGDIHLEKRGDAWLITSIR